MPSIQRISGHLLVAGLLVLGGCVAPPVSFSLPWTTPAEEPPCKIYGYWDRNVRIALDSKHDGAQVTGLAGRIYFNGATDARPIPVHGKVVVEWFDVSGAPDAPHPLMGVCAFDPVSLQKFGKKDVIGWGYTLFCPWTEYRPEVNRVRIHVRYIPEHGDALYAEPATVTLNSDTPVIGQQQTIPVK